MQDYTMTFYKSASEENDHSDPMSISTKALSTPLIGVEELGMAINEETQLQDDDYEKDHGQDDSDKHKSGSRWCESHRVWIIYSGLLWLVFWVCFWTCPETTERLQWSKVNLACSSFMVGGCLYRKAMKDWAFEFMLVVLLPEISINIVLALIVLNEMVAAFVVLNVSLLLISTILLANIARYLWSTHVREGKHGAKDLTSEGV